MINSLKDKLNLALSEGSPDEYKVVYILSRIRKIMEFKKIKQYKVLRVYCNWALHTEIDRTDEVKYILEEFVRNEKSRKLSTLFQDFSHEMKQFALNDLNIQLTDDYLYKFIKVLINTISDTPISFKKSKK